MYLGWDMWWYLDDFNHYGKSNYLFKLAQRCSAQNVNSMIYKNIYGDKGDTRISAVKGDTMIILIYLRQDTWWHIPPTGVTSDRGFFKKNSEKLPNDSTMSYPYYSNVSVLHRFC